MFNLEFLAVIRAVEVERFKDLLPPGGRVLEIGGGSGFQAKLLSEAGLDMVSVDVADSIYASAQVFAVQTYDGVNLPFAGESFDAVISSNVLEHVRDLPALCQEIRRVLKPGGFCVHSMPTRAWTFWTLVTHLIEWPRSLFATLARIPPRGLNKAALMESLRAARGLYGIFLNIVSRRHGEKGTLLWELLYGFGPARWRRELDSVGFPVARDEPMGLFYTGNMLLGPRLSPDLRASLARFLGSACRLYVTRPKS